MNILDYLFTGHAFVIGGSILIASFLPIVVLFLDLIIRNAHSWIDDAPFDESKTWIDRSDDWIRMKVKGHRDSSYYFGIKRFLWGILFVGAMNFSLWPILLPFEIGFLVLLSIGFGLRFARRAQKKLALIKKHAHNHIETEKTAVDATIPWEKDQS